MALHTKQSAFEAIDAEVLRLGTAWGLHRFQIDAAGTCVEFGLEILKLVDTDGSAEPAARKILGACGYREPR